MNHYIVAWSSNKYPPHWMHRANTNTVCLVVFCWNAYSDQFVIRWAHHAEFGLQISHPWTIHLSPKIVPGDHIDMMLLQVPIGPKNSLTRIHDILLTHVGKTHWWPSETSQLHFCQSKTSGKTMDFLSGNAVKEELQDEFLRLWKQVAGVILIRQNWVNKDSSGWGKCNQIGHTIHKTNSFPPENGWLEY